MNGNSGTNLPDYICYNAKLCDFTLVSNPLHPPIDLHGNNSTCLLFDGLRMLKNLYHRLGPSSYTIMERLYILFFQCSNYNQVSSISNNSSLYKCINSSKLISKHRLVDGVDDCLHHDDESYRNSCSLSIPNHRFKCVRKKITICLARARVNDGNKDCDDESDEDYKFFPELVPNSNVKDITFPAICDGFVELNPISIDGRNETDETECAYFPCNTTYTRCDGYWNCPDGADEVNCEWPPMCPINHHICLSPITGNFTCLHIDRVNDGLIDCLGATDERQFCYEKCFSRKCPYRCWNSSICSEAYTVCSSESTCSTAKDNPMSLCQDLQGLGGHVCGGLWAFLLETRAEDFLCKLHGFSKTYFHHLAIISPKYYYYSMQGKIGESQVFDYCLQSCANSGLGVIEIETKTLAD